MDSDRPASAPPAEALDIHEAVNRARIQADARRPPAELLDEAEALIRSAFELAEAGARARAT